jgi:hypothetical protein
MVGNIVDSLFVSFDKDSVESVFTAYEIEDKEERIKLLQKCMAVVDTSNVTNICSVDDYVDELEIFVEGSWRFFI